ncbi:L-histidine N(alpha)-methyltransferase [Sphingomonas histidinilytica]|uniref:L-histidine N(alpha)-methyltransferase n=1 Tax=Rhizorhabdus histidinilytica TaxID=439228 RepID=UPI001ADAD729|nr:L-histidine N(alpha)-methyltransferase [Rhizorhabdus histidinilytica]MBO9378660.1 L-histidine N(alpha)-methyltransferase [Rhizorhabdus histidinilytica]
MGVHADIKLVDQDDEGVDLAFRADVLSGLAQRQKAVPARWFYDRAGSELFERITTLPEYYPTRTETALLKAHAAEVAALVGRGRAVVEFGSGSSVKTPLLLGRMDAAAYVPIDISGDFLRQSSAELAAKFPDLPVIPIEADFMKPVALPASVAGLAMLGFFPGSTIGNMVPRTAIDLLRSMRATLGDRSHLLIGVDRIKDIGRLIAAYDDAEGVTARFNRNLLIRINRELDGTIPVDSFRHVARWNADWNRIEMHLEAIEDIAFEVSGHPVTMRRGETIHTENSHKYTPDQARLMLQASGWSPCAQWSDPEDSFLILLAEATEYRSAP